MPATTQRHPLIPEPRRDFQVSTGADRVCAVAGRVQFKLADGDAGTACASPEPDPNLPLRPAKPLEQAHGEDQ